MNSVRFRLDICRWPEIDRVRSHNYHISINGISFNLSDFDRSCIVT